MTKCVGGRCLRGATRLANLCSAYPLSHKQGIVKPPQRPEASLPAALVCKIYDIIKRPLPVYRSFWKSYARTWNIAPFENIRHFFIDEVFISVNSRLTVPSTCLVMAALIIVLLLDPPFNTLLTFPLSVNLSFSIPNFFFIPTTTQILAFCFLDFLSSNSFVLFFQQPFPRCFRCRRGLILIHLSSTRSPRPFSHSSKCFLFASSASNFIASTSPWCRPAQFETSELEA